MQGAARNIDILTTHLEEATTDSPLRDVSLRSCKARDLSAQAVKMFGIFGSALRKEIEGRMIDDLEGLLFWHSELQSVLAELRQECRAVREDLEHAETQAEVRREVLMEVRAFLIERPANDPVVADLIDHIGEALPEEWGADR